MALATALLKQKLKNRLEPVIFDNITGIGIQQGNYVNIDGSFDTDSYNTAIKNAEDRAGNLATEFSKILSEEVLAWIKTGIVDSIILPATINTVGSPGAQQGPIVPVTVKGLIS